MIKYERFVYGSPVGGISCVFEGPLLIDVAIGEEEAERQYTGSGKALPAAPRLSPAVRAFFAELDAYFRGRLKEFRQATRFAQGTAFEQRIWLALREVPYGETRTYKWIAERAGSPKAVRAAGQALGRNPLPLVLPCHRILASDGTIGGFSSGVEVKKRLLGLENKAR